MVGRWVFFRYVFKLFFCGFSNLISFVNKGVTDWLHQRNFIWDYVHWRIGGWTLSFSKYYFVYRIGGGRYCDVYRGYLFRSLWDSRRICGYKFVLFANKAFYLIVVKKYSVLFVHVIYNCSCGYSVFTLICLRKC